jgi:hypothetical protein
VGERCEQAVVLGELVQEVVVGDVGMQGDAWEAEFRVRELQMEAIGL